ncbi:MAG: xanthine dehydrogenase family protein subunit M [Acidimicrobiia bacterium]|nr:xanthine dehydrogenase family protein subunit M [bacterium]MXZ30184.1 xanthine dehydrogenase family protein subunit M [Acidimicrobiia bacterium]MYE67242.1 xanthine dehydrogenase family protein subunit M [Acidimicrobiia bacterium]
MRYAAPTSVAEAVALLGTEPNSRVFAGATDLVPQLRAGRPEPGVAIDLKKIPRLTGVAIDDGTWRIGAAAPTSDLTANEALTADVPGLVYASGLIGSDQIQNRASLGGNLCNASPAADAVPPLLVNTAQAVVAGPDGERTVPVADIPTGPGRTSLRPGEFVVEFLIDRPPPGTADAYLRLIPRTEMDIAIVGAAARITLDADGSCVAAAIALGAVAPTVITVPAASGGLIGQPIDARALAAVAAAASAAASPIDDKRGTVTYRRQVAGVLAKRAVAEAAGRARNGDGR